MLTVEGVDVPSRASTASIPRHARGGLGTARFYNSGVRVDVRIQRKG
jgi:hypothetical protein